MTRKSWLPITVIILLLGAILYSYLTNGIVYALFTRDAEAVAEYVDAFGWLAAVVFFMLVMLEVVVAPIPPFVLYIAAGLLFGTLPGGTLVLAGNIAGAMIAFGIARRFGRGMVERNVTPRARERFDRFSEKYGAFSIFLLRINPLTSSDAFSYLAGLSSMSLAGFALGTAAGLAPLVYIQTYIGSDLLKDNSLLLLLFTIISVAYLVLFIAGIWYAGRSRKKAGIQS